MTKLIRIELNTYEMLTQLSQKLRIPKTKVLDLSIEKLKRDHIMDAAN